MMVLHILRRRRKQWFDRLYCMTRLAGGAIEFCYTSQLDGF